MNPHALPLSSHPAFSVPVAGLPGLRAPAEIHALARAGGLPRATEAGTGARPLPRPVAGLSFSAAPTPAHHVWRCLLLLLTLAGFAFACANCSGTPLSIQADGTVTLSPVSLFGKQNFESLYVKTPTGAEVKIEKYATQNPDPDLTKAGEKWLTTKTLTDGGVELVKNTVANPNKIPKNPNVIPRNPNVIPKDPNVIPANPNL